MADPLDKSKERQVSCHKQLPPPPIQPLESSQLLTEVNECDDHEMPDGDCIHSNLINTSQKWSSDVNCSHNGDSNHLCWGQRRKVRTLSLALLAVLATFFFLFFLSSTIDGQRPKTYTLVSVKPTKYEVVPGFFAQSLDSTNDTTFDYVVPREFALNIIEIVKFWSSRQ